MRLLALGDFRFTAAVFSLAPDTRDVTVIVVAVHRSSNFQQTSQQHGHFV